MAEIKLYGYCTSPYVRKVGCFLHYKKLDFEFVGVSPVDPKEIAFTDGTMVPVLKIGDEWRRESTELGLWLDELYPERPLLPADASQRKTVLEIDRWVTDAFMPSIFRGAVDAPDNLAFRFRAWRLAQLVSSGSPMPEKIRQMWPDIVRNAPFIKKLAADMDRSETLAEMNIRLAGELLGHIGEGPFLGGMDRPTLADLSIWPQLVFGYVGGLEQELSAAALPQVKNWLSAVYAHLPENPTTIPDFMVVGKLADAGI